MIVVVAEKPSVARDIARVLGCRQKGQGFLSSDTHTVTWALGHLVTLCEPDEIDPKYKRWKREDLPILPTIPPRSSTKPNHSILSKNCSVTRILPVLSVPRMRDAKAS